MLINEMLENQNLTKYRLSKKSGVPQATINDICSGKTDLDKCSAGTLYRIAKALGISVEEILESSRQEYRSSFETFKSNICHRVKDMGDENFIIDLLETDEIRALYNVSVNRTATCWRLPKTLSWREAKEKDHGKRYSYS